MKKFFKLIFIIIFIFAFSVNSYAENENNDYENLFWNNMDSQITDYLDDLEIDKTYIYEMLTDSPVNIIKHLIKIIIPEKRFVKSSILSTTIIIILTAIADSFLKNNSKSSSIIYFVCTMSIISIIIIPIGNLIVETASCIKLATIFVNSYLPVMTSIIIGTKNPSLAFTYNSFTLFVSSIISILANKYFVPLISCLLSFVVFKSFSTDNNNTKIFKTLKKTIVVLITLFSSIYSGILTTQSIFAVSKDSLIMKGFKFISGTFIPIIGSGIGDALSSFLSSILVLKNTIGIIIIVIIVFIFLPVTTELLLWYFALQICSIISSLFNLTHIDNILENISSIVSLLNIIIFFIGFILIISTGIIIMVGK